MPQFIWVPQHQYSTLSVVLFPSREDIQCSIGYWIRKSNFIYLRNCEEVGTTGKQ